MTAVPILSAKSLAKSFGGLQAVKDASILVPQGAITGLIGPNGAGKTTFFNLLCNFIKSDRGTVQFLGQPIQNKPPINWHGWAWCAPFKCLECCVVLR